MGILVKLASAVGAGVRAATDTTSTIASSANNAAKASYRQHIPAVEVEEVKVEVKRAEAIGTVIGSAIGNTTGVITKGAIATKEEIAEAGRVFSEKVSGEVNELPETVEDIVDEDPEIEGILASDRME